MNIVYTVEGLRTLADEVNTKLKSVEEVAPQGFLGLSWEKNTRKLTLRNNEILESLPETVRVSSDVAKECIEHEVAYNDKVEEIFSKGINPVDGLKKIGKIAVYGNTGRPLAAAHEIVSGIIDMIRSDNERGRQYQEALSARHEVIGPILKSYALCHDTQGYFLRKATWVNHSENMYSGMGNDSTTYSSVPSVQGIDASVDVSVLFPSSKRNR